jgi:HEPN domain-containing protein
MPYFNMTDDKFKLVVANHFFVAPADYNYTYARFCRITGLHKEFSWQCLQALEKYFKAGLILNNISVKQFSHDLPRLLKKHCEVYGDFRITDPVRPEKLNEELWKPRTLNDLVEWIHYFGHPDSRYGLRSYINNPSDLFLLDEFVFELRRRIGRLESVIGTDIYANDEAVDDILEQCRGEKFSHLITAYPKFQLSKMKVPDIKFADVGERMEDALYSWNFPLARNDADLERPAPGTVSAQFGGFGNSML